MPRQELPIEALCVSACGINALETVTPQSGRVEAYEAMYIGCTICCSCIPVCVDADVQIVEHALIVG
jgi:formate hydrogenlyase subunit 6/NADH:ubiquinone oxidoreductase subunit I